MEFYMMEVQRRGSWREASPLKAETLTAAKREASRRQAFFGTFLYIGTEIDANGFIRNPFAVKAGNKWENL